MINLLSQSRTLDVRARTENRVALQCQPLALMRSEERERLSSVNASRGVVIRRFHPHRRHVLGVAMTNSKLVTSSADGTCRVFDRTDNNFNLALVFAEHADMVFGCQILDESSSTVLTWSRDCTAKIWNINNGETLLTLSHAAPVKSAFCNGDLILTCSLPNSISIWSLITRSLITTINNAFALASPLAVALPFVAFGTFGHLLHLWEFNDRANLEDPASMITMKKYRGHSRAILAVAIDESRERILTGSEDKTSMVFELRTGRCMARFTGHGESVLSCTFSPTRKDLCITSSADKTCRLWDLESTRCVMVLRCNDTAICAVFNAGYAFVGCGDNSAILFDISEGAFDKLVVMCHGLKDRHSSVRVLPLEIVRRVKAFLV